MNLVKKRTRLEDDVIATPMRMMDVQMPIHA